MTEKEILVLLDTVYQYLMELHEKDATFKFKVHPQDDDNFKKGDWFSYVRGSYHLGLTFWACSNANMDTPLIEFFIPFTSDGFVYYPYISLWNRDEDNENRKSYFDKMANELGIEKMEPIGKGFIEKYHKTIVKEQSVLNLLDYLIKNEKPKIDTYIKQNPFPNVVDFITDEDFAKDIERVETYRSKTLNNDIWQESQVLLEEFKLSQYTETHLNNALSRLYVSNFQGIKEATIENLPLNKRWIFLTGENGFGKTSVLRAIAKGLVGDESFVQPMPKNTQILLNGFINNKTFRNNSSEKSDAKIPIATYGVSRFQLTASDQTASERSQQRTYSLFHDDGQLINIEQELITTFAYNKPRFEQLRQIFLKIIPNLKDIEIDTTNGSPKVRYYEKDEQNRTYEAVSLNELAAGYRSILTMIGDMVIRLSENKEAVQDISAIVLIDELDAHLHPKYQYELPKLLSDVFPKIQFIVTTHSPIPILGLPEDNQPIVLTVERNLEKGITIDRKDDDFDIRQLNPEALLTSPIFNFQTLFARGAKPETIIPTSDFKEVIEIEAIKKRLKNLREAGLVQ
jgi:predicted ATP-binding protein involved in virulence